jgi:phage terminase large subunit-like protein
VKSKRSWHGSPPPTSATPRTDRATFGGDVAETAAMLGVEFMGWQTLVADVGLEHDDGRPAHREVDVSIDRQTGKSTLILAVAVHRMLTRPGSWLTYTSASRLAARRKLLKVWWPLIRRSPLRDRFTVTKGTGSESLECHNGSVLLLLSGDEASGHGDSIDLAFLDEAWSLTEASEQAVRPAMAARPDGQLWVMSTAGTRRSAYWRSKVDAGRTTAELGRTEGTCFVEWAASPDTDVTDSATWPGFMPALGRTISAETVAADLASMSLREWRRAYANQWDDEVDDDGWRVIPRDVWMAGAL